MKNGKFVFIHDVEQDDEDQINGLTGKWGFNEDTELFKEYSEITFKMIENEDTDEDNNRLYNEIRKIVEDDLSNILGYNVTIKNGDYYSWDNDAEAGQWYKIGEI
jgi:hypothetical protein